MRSYLHGTAAHNGRMVPAGNLSASVGTFPIGIDCRAFAEMATSLIGITSAQQIIRGSHETSIIAGVERLDYSKGIPQRLKAFELFLQRHPDYQGRVSDVPNRSPLTNAGISSVGA